MLVAEKQFGIMRISFSLYCKEVRKLLQTSMLILLLIILWISFMAIWLGIMIVPCLRQKMYQVKFAAIHLIFTNTASCKHPNNLTLVYAANNSQLTLKVKTDFTVNENFHDNVPYS